MDIECDKRNIRNSILNTRKNLAETDVGNNSSLITGKLLSFPEFEKSKMLMCYVDFRNEVCTSGFLSQCLEMGKNVSVPLIIDDSNSEKVMVACQIYNIGTDLQKGYFGVMEPVKNKAGRIAPENIDFIVIPGVAFDVKGNRLGYGGGFYDRFLPLLRKDCLKVGICHELQLVENLPVNEYDLPMDIIVTEKRTLSFI
ncbi:MAG: 5-formyltetrahydrofolate cyclo-ligase [Bacillota bacterium]|nr:5-formyltetrahydrofolate cyclo-ligase [Bacillota bacterium]